MRPLFCGLVTNFFQAYIEVVLEALENRHHSKATMFHTMIEETGEVIHANAIQ